MRPNISKQRRKRLLNASAIITADMSEEEAKYQVYDLIDRLGWIVNLYKLSEKAREDLKLKRLREGGY